MKVIINADDFGISESVNNAIRECFRRGFIDRTTIMVNMPCYKSALEIAREDNLFNKVGLHLVLDEGSPLTDIMSQNSNLCHNGQFIKGNLFRLKNRLYLSRHDRFCIIEEVTAQMKKYIDSGFTLMHLDSHHLIHTSSPLLLHIINELAKEYGFISMRNVAYYKHDNYIAKIVKSYIRRIISKNYQTTTNFMAYQHYNQNIDDIEYMSHPDYINDTIVDIIDRKRGIAIKIPQNVYTK